MKKPAKPVNHRSYDSFRIEGWSVNDVLELINHRNLNPAECTFGTDWDGDYQIPCLEVYKERYSEDEFRVKMEEYEKKKGEYEEWYKDNKDVLEKAKRQKKKDKLLKVKERIEEKIKRLDE